MDNKQNKPENQIRIGAISSVGGVLRYVNALIKDNKFQEYDFSAIGIAIGKLVSAVELLKVVNPGFYQVNKMCSISEDIKDTSGKVISQRFYPKLEVRLSLVEPKEKGEGYQPKLDESVRNKLFTLLNNAVSRPRGGRGGPRGSRGIRGPRGGPRGGMRGAPRGGMRGAPRGGMRGAPRGGMRGAPRGLMRGPRGAPRGNRPF